MAHILKSALSSNLTLKIISLIIGVTFWFFFGQSHQTELYFKVPLYFYNTPHNATIKAPETMQIKLTGKRSDFYALDIQNLFLHIDGTTLHNGDNRLAISSYNLFLPPTIKLVHYSPSNIMINIKKQNET